MSSLTALFADSTTRGYPLTSQSLFKNSSGERIRFQHQLISLSIASIVPTCCNPRNQLNLGEEVNNNNNNNNNNNIALVC